MQEETIEAISVRERTKRWSVFFMGLLCMGLGISTVTNSHLGTTPITSLPLVLSNVWGVTLGLCTLGLNVALILAQMPLLGKVFSLKLLMQIPGVLAFTVFIDFGMWVTGMLPMETWPARMGMCLVGCVILALGIVLEILSQASLVPGEGLLIALAHRVKVNVGNLKVLLDVGLVLSAACVGLVCLHGLVGIREGTVAAAMLTGIFVRLLAKKIGPSLQHWLVA